LPNGGYSCPKGTSLVWALKFAGSAQTKEVPFGHEYPPLGILKEVFMEEHFKIINEMLGEHYNSILDLGSGKTSMGILLKLFPNTSITGICYPGDHRKLDSIKENCIGNFDLVEMDICKEKPKGKYDLVLCHLLLGETLKFGNILGDMLDSIFSINANQICIIDFKEDIDIDLDFVKKVGKEKGYLLVYEKVFKKECPQQFTKFKGENYIGLLFTKE
jgi:hypothetical protein